MQLRYKVGPLLVINGVITSISRVMTPPFTTSGGPPCICSFFVGFRGVTTNTTIEIGKQHYPVTFGTIRYELSWYKDIYHIYLLYHKSLIYHLSTVQLPYTHHIYTIYLLYIPLVLSLTKNTLNKCDVEKSSQQKAVGSFFCVAQVGIHDGRRGLSTGIWDSGILKPQQKRSRCLQNRGPITSTKIGVK